MKKIVDFFSSQYFPVLCIIVIWLFFSMPAFIGGKILFPSDYLASNFSPWSAYEEYFSAVKNDSMPDIITQIYPWKDFVIDSYKNFQIPLWNPYSFAGTPFLANYQSAAFTPLNIGFFIFPFADWWGIFILLQPLFAGLFTYLYVRSIKIGKLGSLLSALSFMFCGFITSWMAYGTLPYAILYLPLSLFAVEKYLTLKNSRYLFLLFLTIPLSFFSGHFQISLYFLLFLTVYILFRVALFRSLKSAAIIFTSVMCGILVSLLQLLPSIELYSQSFRSTIFQKTEVIPWGYIPTLIAPDFFGNPTTRNAWFGHYAEWNAYIGVVGMFFAMYALSRIKSKYVMFFTVTAVVSLLCAFQSPLLDLLVILKIPVLSTSALSRIVVIFSFSAAILSGLGMDFFLHDVKERKAKIFMLIGGIFLAIFGTLWVVILTKTFISPEYASIAFSNLRFPTLILFALFMLIALLYVIRSKRKVVLFSCLIILLISIDMLRFSLKWVPFQSKELVYPDAPVTKIYKDIAGFQRVFGNFGAEDSVYYKLPSLEGYDAIYVRRYGQFISYLDKGVLSDSARSGVELPLQGKYMLPAANFLGVTYFVHKVSDGQNVWEFPFWKYNPKTLKLLYDDKKFQVLKNTNAFPRAFLVSNVKVETDSEKILQQMFRKDTNLLQTAFIEKKGASQKLSSGSAQISAYTPNKISININTVDTSFLVLTDVFYPGWKAYVNGSPTEIYRTDFAFRGIFVPGGSSTIIFSYEPDSFRYGVITAIIGLLGIIILCVALKKK